MITRHSATKAEPMTANGDVLLSHNHIALLHGLYDRPHGHAGSRSEWVRATRPFIERMKGTWDVWGLRGAMLTLHPRWVKQERNGRFIAATLTARGRRIVERSIPAWIRGRGAYEGLQSVDAAAISIKKSRLPDSDIREAIAYSRAFGLPLLMRSIHRTGGTIFAVSEGLGSPFRLMCYEELHMRGPQSWHWEWTGKMIAKGEVPCEYLKHFAGYDYDDVVEHLQEIQSTDEEQFLYLRVYNGVPLASRSRIEKFLLREVDYRDSGFDAGEFIEWAREESPVYRKALNGIGSRLSWLNPDTGASIGAVYRRESESGSDEIIATTPEVLSCLQRHWDNCNVGLAIETRYQPRN